MPRRATDRPVRAGPERTIDEFSERISAGGRAVGEMLGDQFPAVVIGGGDVGIGAFEERNVRLVPIPVPVVPEGLPIEQLLLVEHVGPERGR